MNRQAITFMIAVITILNVNSVQSNSESNSNKNNFIKNESMTNVQDQYTNPTLILIEKELQQKQLENQKEQEELKEQQKLQEELKEQQKLQEELKEQERKKNVKFNSYDITQVSNITYEEMKKVLSDSHYANLLEISDAFVDGEKQYGVNAFALVGIAGLESGWNTSKRANNGTNNIVGMDVPEDHSTGTVYKSKYDCILDLARQLNQYYLNPNGTYYNGVSTSKINKKYSANKDWYKTVDSIGDELVAIYNKEFRNNEPY